MQSINTLRKQKGITLIEIIVAFAIILVVAGVTVGLITQAQASSRISQVQSQVQMVSAQATSMASNGNYDGITIQVLAQAQKIPASQVDGANMRTPYGTNLTLANGAITVNGVPTSACNSLADNLAGLFFNVMVGTAELTQNSTPAERATACATSAAPNMTFNIIEPA